MTSIERGAETLDHLQQRLLGTPTPDIAAQDCETISNFSNCVEQEKKPLQRAVAAPTAFPVEVLGEILAPAVHKMAESIQAPEAICGNSVLAAAALAAQAHADVLIDGRIFPISEFFVTIGESGERKSAVDKAALSPHRQYQEELQSDYAKKRSEYEISAEAFRKAKDEAITSSKSTGYENKRKALLNLGNAPREPLAPILVCEEPTYEGMVKMLRFGQPSVGLFSDEGGRFIGGHGMNKDNLLKTASGMSSFWDGKPISRVRASDGCALLPGRRVSCHLMAQPDVSRLMLSNAVLLEQGLLSRCLVTWPMSTAGTRFYREIDLSASRELLSYRARLLEILRTPKAHAEDAENELTPRQLPLDSDAKRVWIAFHDNIEKQLKDGAELAQIRGLANKAPEHAARLAGVLAVVEDINCASVRLEWIKAGIELTTHYINEALRLFDSGVTDPNIADAEKLLTWLKTKRGTVSLVEIYQTGPSRVRTAERARSLLRILYEHGQVEQDLDGAEYAGAHRKEAWRVLP